MRNIRCGRRIEQLGRLNLLTASNRKEGKSRVMLTVRVESKLSNRRASAIRALLGRKNKEGRRKFN